MKTEYDDNYALQEFKQHTRGRTVKCAELTFGADYNDDAETFTLPCGYTQAELEAFHIAINREYDAGYGAQELFGTIWYTDDTWSDRHEYDGSENWVHRTCPPIPPTLVKP